MRQYNIRVKSWPSNPEMSGSRPARLCLFHMKPTAFGFIVFLSHLPGAFKCVRATGLNVSQNLWGKRRAPQLKFHVYTWNKSDHSIEASAACEKANCIWTWADEILSG